MVEQQQQELQLEPEKKSSFVGTLISFVVLLLFIVGFSWVIRTFVFSAYEIPSGSMEETIMTGDMVFAEKVSYNFRDVQAGDIVTFTDPENADRTLIKRCIATAGQTINITGDGILYIDGQPQTESYVNGKKTLPLSKTKISFPYTVPDGCIWVMGDNRTNSQDSRYFGAIPLSSVTAHAVFVYWPFNHFGALE